jgi:hypothetical protein
MGLTDKMKETATDLVGRGQEVVSKGQAMLDERKAKKEADGMLRDLGAAVYAARCDGSDSGAEARIDQLVARLREHEATHGKLDTSPEPSEEPAGGQ